MFVAPASQNRIVREGFTIGKLERIAMHVVLVCEECSQRWTDPHERWRVYLMADEQPAAILYCPECARREFAD
jgi:hypothetical protein